MSTLINVISIVIIVLFLQVFITMTFRRIHNNKIDKYLNISTKGIRAWKGKESRYYHRAESTPYIALIELTSVYNVNEESQFVDFGSGKGRVAIFLHEKLDVNITGVELNEKTLHESEINKRNYLIEHENKSNKKIDFVLDYAENYKIKKKDNRFFFFNPFNVEIFEKVINNIVEDAIENKKEIEIILYYPTKSYKKVMQKHFDVKETINFEGTIGWNEKFKIYKMKSTNIRSY